MNERLFVMDTNVLMHDPEALFNFKQGKVIIPLTVLEELDHHKTEIGEQGYNARQAIRYLDECRQRGPLGEGVSLPNGSYIQVILPGTMVPFLDKKVADNTILSTAYTLKQQGHTVVFISKDLNARVKADVLGIESQDYLRGHISQEHFYRGWVHIEVPAISLKSEKPPELRLLLLERGLTVNEFILVSARSNMHNSRIFRYLGGEVFKEVFPPHLTWPLKPRNPQQVMALDLLFDDEIQLISLIGTAGTGKTFLALLAGLYQVLVKNSFEKMLISRPVVPLGPDIGYLPGTIEEKLHSWMQPIYDNMDFIVHAINSGSRTFAANEPSEGGAYEMVYADHRQPTRRSGSRYRYDRNDYHGRKGYKKDRRSDSDMRVDSIEELVRKGKISMEPITYMRGRSIPYQLILIDEVQNVTPHEVKTLISRVGEGSKIILAGDPYQIDTLMLDFTTNGLIVGTNKFKGQSIFGTVFLESSERSTLSKLVNELW